MLDAARLTRTERDGLAGLKPGRNALDAGITGALFIVSLKAID